MSLEVLFDLRLVARGSQCSGRSPIDFPCPPALIQIADLLAIDRPGENRGNDFKLLDAVLVVASVKEGVS
jgi:hypothetical protein